MIRKFFQGTLFSFMIVLLPAVGNRQALYLSQLWLMFALGILANLFQPPYKPFDKSAPREDKNTALQNLWSCSLVQVGGIVEAVYFRYPESFRWDAVATIALAVMILGLILRTWAVLTLGKFFTWHVTVQPGQKVIRAGPYRLIRHPSYTGALLTYLFGPVFLHAWVTMLLGLFALPASFLRRIRLEEVMLKRSLGKDYETYCKEVHALIPGIW